MPDKEEQEHEIITDFYMEPDDSEEEQEPEDEPEPEKKTKNKQEEPPPFDPVIWANDWVNQNEARKMWAYDPAHGGHHIWDGCRWEPFQIDKIAYGKMWSKIMATTGNLGIRKLLLRNKTHVLDAVDQAILRNMPFTQEDDSFLATAGGMVFLRTGRIREFDPLVDTHRAVTKGIYYDYPTDEECWECLKNRFTPSGVQLISDEDLVHLVDIVALAITGRAQKHRPLCFLYGMSGGGKGGTQRLVREALGERSVSVGKNWLERRMSDIDAVTTNMIMRQPLVVTISESRRVDMDRLLALTGDDGVNARYPHGLPVEGDLPCLLMISTTEPPELDMDAGFERRMSLIHFPHKEAIAGDKVENPTRWEADALLTLAIRQARFVYQDGYVATGGNEIVREQFSQQADELGSYIRLIGDDIIGMTLQGISARYKEETGSTVPAQKLGTRVREMGYAITEARKRMTSAENPKRLSFIHQAGYKPNAGQIDEWANEERIRNAAGGFPAIG